MRLYFAVSDNSARDHCVGYTAGVRNTLLSYAFMSDRHSFWTDAAVRDKGELLRMYFSMPTNAEDQQAAMLHAGLQNALLSYANANSAQFRFWTELTEDERSEHVRLYLAGNGKSPNSSQRDHDTGVVNRLLSYAFIDDWAKQEFEYWIGAPPPKVNVLLDSGAFSAWRLGRTIDIGEYCDYLHANKDRLAAYIVLDVIRAPASATRANLLEMRRRGLDPLPVYHSDVEPLDVWEEILRENTGYVCLGGLAVERPRIPEMRKRLNECWRMVERHWPVRVHGLGVMTQWMVEQYPFYSVDSASAIMGAGMGRVMRHDRPHDQRDDDGVLALDGWRDHLDRGWDGLVADGVGRVAAGARKSDSAHEGRRIRNIQAQLELEGYVTELWADRGVRWED